MEQSHPLLFKPSFQADSKKPQSEKNTYFRQVSIGIIYDCDLTSNLGKAKGGSFQKKEKPIGSDCATLNSISCHLTFLLKSLPFLYVSIDMSSVSLLSLYFSIQISTSSLLFFSNLYFLFDFSIEPLLSLYFSIEISRNLYF